MAENPFRRLVAWLRRAKTAPALVERVADVQLDNVRDVQTVGGQVDELNARVSALESAVHDELARTRQLTTEQADLNLMTTRALARDAALQDLLSAVGDPPQLRPGLTIVTISWNHSAFLRACATSALATLDLLPPDEHGRVLVLDDGSTDETPEVLEELRSTDDRIHAVRSPANLGLSRARNVLLHLADTTHALMLDADNTASPEGIIDLYRVAGEWDAAFTFGNVIMAAPDRSRYAVASNEPLATSYFFAGGPHIDTLGVLDVAYFRQIGGYSPDPVFHAFDDHEIIHRLSRLGALIAFVPTVAGRYRIDDLSHSQAHRASHEAALARLRRAYNQDGRLTAQQPAALAAHPATGPLWATPAAIAARPDLATSLSATVDAAP